MVLDAVEWQRRDDLEVSVGPALHAQHHEVFFVVAVVLPGRERRRSAEHAERGMMGELEIGDR